jgi:hypothetical protein
MKFEYSPGLIGYGAKGADGSSGLQGLAIYFTDYNPLSDRITLKSAIENNEVLWSTAIPGTKLPGERKYAINDLTVDSRGFVYRITDSVNGDYINTGMSLNKSSFFQLGTESDNGFSRYFNKLDTSLRYIIDNVFTDSLGINYILSPSKIYGIAPKNFARIEYSNVDASYYNAFSLYSSGENVNSDDHKSLAIVEEIASNKFHIGNIDSSNLFRDVDLILDVSSLRYTREIGNQFNKNTIVGTVLTNAEKNPNTLFDNSFTSLPASFSCISAPTHVTINWVLSDFCSDPCSGILYFYKKEDASGNYTMDPSMLRPLVFHNVDPVGNITISALTLNQTYEYFMSVCKNGWERNSKIQPIATTDTLGFFTIINPAPPALILPAISSKNAISITTNSFTGWTLAVDKNWISALQKDTTIPITGNPVAGPYIFDVSLSAYNGYTQRTGTLTFNSEAGIKTIGITQNRRLPMSHSVYMSSYINTVSDARSRIVFDPPLTTGQSVTINAYIHAKSRARGGSHTADTHTQISVYKNGISVANTLAYAHSATNTNHCETQELYFTLAGITSADIIEVRQGPAFDCVYWTSGTNGWEEGAAYIELNSVTDGYDTFNIDSTRKIWNVTRISCNCGTNCNFVSWIDLIPTALPTCT